MSDGAPLAEKKKEKRQIFSLGATKSEQEERREGGRRERGREQGRVNQQRSTFQMKERVLTVFVQLC